MEGRAPECRGRRGTEWAPSTRSSSTCFEVLSAAAPGSRGVPWWPGRGELVGMEVSPLPGRGRGPGTRRRDGEKGLLGGV
jgi:hypothetical protein